MSPSRELQRRLKRLELCLPRLAKKPPAEPGWIHQIKHDGFRILAEHGRSRSAAGRGGAGKVRIIIWDARKDQEPPAAIAAPRGPTMTLFRGPKRLGFMRPTSFAGPLSLESET
jgi:hypothetical protein